MYVLPTIRYNFYAFRFRFLFSHHLQVERESEL